MTKLILPKEHRNVYKVRNFTENVGKRLWRLAEMDSKPQELRDHYKKIATQRVQQWVKLGAGLTPAVADTLAFSIHSEAENSWYKLRGWLDDDEKLSIEKDSEYLDIVEEEQDYIGWLKKKGLWHED